MVERNNNYEHATTRPTHNKLQETVLDPPRTALSRVIIARWTMLGSWCSDRNQRRHNRIHRSRNYATHKLKHGSLREWDPYSLNGIKGRVDQTDNACGEPGQTQHGIQYSGIEVDSEGKSWDAGQAFAAGESIKFRVAITANHGGIIELRYVCTDRLDKSSTLTHLDFYDKAPDLETAAKCYTSNSHSNIWRDNDGCCKPRTLHRAVVDPASKTYHASHPEWHALPKATASECMDPLQQTEGHTCLWWAI